MSEHKPVRNITAGEVMDIYNELNDLGLGHDFMGMRHSRSVFGRFNRNDELDHELAGKALKELYEKAWHGVQQRRRVIDAVELVLGRLSAALGEREGATDA